MEKTKIVQVRKYMKINEENGNMSDVRNEKNQRPGRNDQSKVIIGGMIALAIFAAISFHGSNGKSTSRYSVPAGPVKGEINLQELVDEKTTAYLAENRRILADFEQELTTVGQQDFARASRNVNDTVERLTGFGVTSKLCYKMAKDRLFSDSHATSDALMDVMKKPVISPCLQGCSKVDEAYRKFVFAIEKSRNQYCADLAQYGKDLSAKDVMPGQELLLENLDYISKKICDIAIEKFAVAVGIGIEAVCLRSSLRVLASVCGHVAAKLAGSATMGVVCPAADGPLPIGDIAGAAVVVGGVAWCAWDIRKVCKVLPAELRTSMQNMIRECRQAAYAQAKQEANRLVIRLESEAASMQSELKKEISR